MKSKRVKFQYNITPFLHDQLMNSQNHMDYFVHHVKTELGKKLAEDVEISFVKLPNNLFEDLILNYDICVIDGSTLDKCLRLLKGYGSQYSPTLIEVEELLLGIKEYNKVTGETK